MQSCKIWFNTVCFWGVLTKTKKKEEEKMYLMIENKQRSANVNVSRFIVHTYCITCEGEMLGISLFSFNFRIKWKCGLLKSRRIYVECIQSVFVSFTVGKVAAMVTLSAACLVLFWSNVLKKEENVFIWREFTNLNWKKKIRKRKCRNFSVKHTMCKAYAGVEK